MCGRLSIWESLCFALVSLNGSWFLAGMINIVPSKTLKVNTAIFDCPQIKLLKMITAHVNSSLLLYFASHSGTCWLGISFMCQSKMIFSACPKTLMKLWPQLTSFDTNVHWHVYQMTLSTLTFGVRLMSQPWQVPGAWGRCVMSFIAKKLPEI